MDLSIILLNYKSRGLIRLCIRGILDVAPRLNYEIIVVDNNSKDGIEEIQEEYPSVKFIASDKNIGYGPGNNLGIKAANGRYVLVMNPDIVILDNALEKMVSYMDSNPNIGILGPRLNNADRTVQYSCYTFPSFFIPAYRRTRLGKTNSGVKELKKYLMEDWDHNEIREVDWLLGACVVFRREMLDKIGLYDERFFLYFEDTDLCRRAWESGWKVVYYPESVMIHYHHRESLDGGVVKSLLKPVTRAHIASWLKYFWKYRGRKLPNRA